MNVCMHLVDILKVEFTSTFKIWNSQTHPVLIVSNPCDFIKMFKSVYTDIKIDSYICRDSKNIIQSLDYKEIRKSQL